MIRKIRKSTAVILIICLIITALLGTVFIASHSNHICHVAGCSLCYQLSIARNTAQGVSSQLFGIALNSLLMLFLLFSMPVAILDIAISTPIRLKDKLLN